MQKHSMSFFGQKTAVILDSSDWSDPFVFLRFLKKKHDGQWEKPSQKEGKALKLNLLEMVAILEVCANRTPKWQTVHKYQEETTAVSVERQEGGLVLMITGYAKPLKGPEVKIFWDLVAHIYEEKIAHATGAKGGEIITANEEPEPIKGGHTAQPAQTVQTAQTRQPIPPVSPSPPPPDPVEPVESEIEFENPFEADTPSRPPPKYDPEAWLNALKAHDDFRLVPGDIVSKSAKAIAFQVMNLKQIWVPSSCINPLLGGEGGLWIKNWFLEKKLADIFS